jgi:RNA polymerase sigma-70 factor (ECF subfamily)
MGAGTIAMHETRLSLLDKVRDLGDERSWIEFHAIYRPLIFAYLRKLGLDEHSAEDVTQEVFQRLMVILPKFKLDRQRGRFRTYLWRLTYNTLVARARRKKARERAEQEWVLRFSEVDESRRRELKGIFELEHRRRIFEVVLPKARARASETAWACFEGRLVRRRPAAEVAAELGIAAKNVYVHASRVLQDVRRRCTEIEGELGDDFDFDVS